MAIVAGDKGAVWTVNQVTLTASTVNIVQVDWTSTSTKVSTAESNCICSHKSDSMLKKLYDEYYIQHDILIVHMQDNIVSFIKVL